MVEHPDQESWLHRANRQGQSLFFIQYGILNEKKRYARQVKIIQIVNMQLTILRHRETIKNEKGMMG